MPELPDRIQLWASSSDDSGVAGFLRWLSQLVEVRSQHPEIRARVVELFRGLPSGAWSEEIGCLWDWVLGSWRFLPDPFGLEHVLDPVEADRQIEATGEASDDCESLAAYLATLLSASGIPWMWDAFGKPGSGRLSHLALRIWDRSRREWISADPSAGLLVGAGLGDSRFEAGGRREIFTRDGETMRRKQTAGDALFGDLGAGAAAGSAVGSAVGSGQGQGWASIVASLLGTGGQIAQQFGPTGKIVGGVLTGAQGVVQAATGQPVTASMVPAKPAAPAVSLGKAAAIGGAVLAAMLLL